MAGSDGGDGRTAWRYSVLGVRGSLGGRGGGGGIGIDGGFKPYRSGGAGMASGTGGVAGGLGDVGEGRPGCVTVDVTVTAAAKMPSTSCTGEGIRFIINTMLIVKS